MYYIYYERKLSAKIHLKVRHKFKWAQSLLESMLPWPCRTWISVNRPEYYRRNKLTKYNVVKLFPAGSIFKHITHLQNNEVYSYSRRPRYEGEREMMDGMKKYGKIK